MQRLQISLEPDLKTSNFDNDVEIFYDCLENSEPTDEQATTYKRLIDEARPEDPRVVPIVKIVEEELGAFLEGQKTAEETAKVMDSSVQLYLDENS